MKGDSVQGSNGDAFFVFLHKSSFFGFKRVYEKENWPRRTYIQRIKN